MRKFRAPVEPSQAALREMPEIDFTKVTVRPNPYAARAAAEGMAHVRSGRPTKRWTVQDHLKTRRQVVAFWEAVVAESRGDASLLVKALGEIARSKGMAAQARRAGLTRTALRNALGRDGGPSFASMMRLLHAMKLAPFARPQRPLHGRRLVSTEKR